MKKVAFIVTKIHSIINGVSFIVAGASLLIFGLLFSLGVIVFQTVQGVDPANVDALRITSLIFGIVYLILAGIFIPLGIIALVIGVKNANFLNVAKSKDEIIARGVITIIFASAPGGVLMLCIPQSAFSSNEKKSNEILEGEVVDK